MRIEQELYKSYRAVCRENAQKVTANASLAQLMKSAMPKKQGGLGLVSQDDWDLSHPTIKSLGRELVKAGGVTTSLGFNFFDLRGPPYFIFPVNTPFIQMIPRQGRQNDGVCTAAHWKATRNPNS